MRKERGKKKEKKENKRKKELRTIDFLKDFAKRLQVSLRQRKVVSGHVLREEFVECGNKENYVAMEESRKKVFKDHRGKQEKPGSILRGYSISNKHQRD